MSKEEVQEPSPGTGGAAPSFAELFEKSVKRVAEGEVVKGRILKLTKDYAIVDIGYKSEGLVPVEEFRAGRGGTPIAVGDEVLVLVEEAENEDGQIVLSKEKADKQKVWEDISRACEQDAVIEGEIIGRVKGGFSVDIGVKAFLPGSQVDVRPVRNLEKMLGKRFKFKVIKFNRRRGNIVLSRRVLLEEERRELRSKTLDKLREGILMTGTVKNITEYGAFIDLGGIDGLLHITDMSWGRVNHPSEVLGVGDEIKIKVLKYDPERQRVSLGLKQLSADPWGEVEEKYAVGQRVQGRVVSLTDYGAFVELEPGIEGLIHISEMSWTRKVKHPSKVVAINDSVEVAILDIDSRNKRISLGMKQVEPNPWDRLAETYPLGSRVKGEVRSLTNFGAFVGVEEGVDGLIHVSDLSWTQKIKHPGEMLKKGDIVEAVVLKIDKENERFSLGLKQLEKNPWERIEERYPVGKEIEGQVTGITDFGVFVRLEEGVEGLVYLSELAAERVKDPRSVVKEDETLRAQVIKVDPKEQKIGLSIRALEEKGAREALKRIQNEEEASTKLGDVLREKLAEQGRSAEELVSPKGSEGGEESE